MAGLMLPTRTFSRAQLRARTKPARELCGSLLKLRGSVIPRSLVFALPSACIACMLKMRYKYAADSLPDLIKDGEILHNNAAWTGFSFIMGFLFVFRTSQAYSRFWEGVTVGHRMYAEWFDFASAVVAFSKYSKADTKTTEIFHHRLVRLLSLLHAAASATLRGIDGSHFELIDIDGLEEGILERALVDEHPTTMVAQWIMELVMEGIEDKIVTAPPPIVSRAYQEFANGMVAFHDAVKIQSTKFPFPYTQLSALMLMFHWILTPFIMCQWCGWPSWAFILTLIQVLVFWSLHFTAVEIEMPFHVGELTEKHAAARMQKEFNSQLLSIINPRTREIPKLAECATLDPTELAGHLTEREFHDPSSEMFGACTKKRSGKFQETNTAQSIFFEKLRENKAERRSRQPQSVIDSDTKVVPVDIQNGLSSGSTNSKTLTSASFADTNSAHGSECKGIQSYASRDHSARSPDGPDCPAANDREGRERTQLAIPEEVIAAGRCNERVLVTPPQASVTGHISRGRMKASL